MALTSGGGQGGKQISEPEPGPCMQIHHSVPLTVLRIHSYPGLSLIFKVVEKKSY